MPCVARDMWFDTKLASKHAEKLTLLLLLIANCFLTRLDTNRRFWKVEALLKLVSIDIN